jgi:hypothetical protein
MNWDHNHYSLTCLACGHTGVLVRSSDDRGPWDASVTGFHEMHLSVDGAVLGRCPQCGSLDAIKAEWLLRTQ